MVNIGWDVRWCSWRAQFTRDVQGPVFSVCNHCFKTRYGFVFYETEMRHIINISCIAEVLIFPDYDDQRRTNRMHSTDTSTVLLVTLCCGKTLPTEPSCKRQMFPKLWREARRDPHPREPEGREHPKRSRMSWRRKRKPGRSGKPWSTQFSCTKPSKILHEISINVSRLFNL